MSIAYSATTKCTKRAWIREPNYPIGRPAPGKIKCACNNSPLSEYGNNENVNCNCGRIYDSKGYILKDV